MGGTAGYTQVSPPPSCSRSFQAFPPTDLITSVSRPPWSCLLLCVWLSQEEVSFQAPRRVLGTLGNNTLMVGFQAATISALGLGKESQALWEEGRPLSWEPGTGAKSVPKAGKEAVATEPLTSLSHRAVFVLGPVGADRPCQLYAPAEKATGAVLSQC